jgi:hypothetical protein
MSGSINTTSEGRAALGLLPSATRARYKVHLILRSDMALAHDDTHVCSPPVPGYHGTSAVSAGSC